VARDRPGVARSKLRPDRDQLPAVCLQMRPEARPVEHPPDRVAPVVAGPGSKRRDPFEHFSTVLGQRRPGHDECSNLVNHHLLLQHLGDVRDMGGAGHPDDERHQKHADDG